MGQICCPSLIKQISRKGLSGPSLLQYSNDKTMSAIGCKHAWMAATAATRLQRNSWPTPSASTSGWLATLQYPSACTRVDEFVRE